MYAGLLEPLVNKFTRTLFDGAEYTQRTYAANDERVFLRGRGVVAVQYTPYDHNGRVHATGPSSYVLRR
jgi:hypothetical protein